MAVLLLPLLWWWPPGSSGVTTVATAINTRCLIVSCCDGCLLLLWFWFFVFVSSFPATIGVATAAHHISLRATLPSSPVRAICNCIWASFSLLIPRPSRVNPSTSLSIIKELKCHKTYNYRVPVIVHQ